MVVFQVRFVCSQYEYSLSWGIEIFNRFWHLSIHCIFLGRISEDYSTDEEYLNTIAGFEDESDEEAAKKTFDIIDHDGSGQISIDEFLEYSKRIYSGRHTSSISGALGGTLQATGLERLETLEKKVEENSKKLDRICKLLEEIKSPSS